LRLIILCAFSIIVMAVDHRNGHLESVRNALTVALHPIRAAVDFPFASVNWAKKKLRDQSALLEENEQLKRERLSTNVQLQRLASAEAENRRLRALMDSAERLAERVLVAGILSVDLDPYRQRIVIDKGERHGVYRGQPLLDAFGVVGQVTHTNLFSSEAILVSDADHALPVEVNRNGLRSVALGSGDENKLVLSTLPNNADIEVGDLLVSTGLGGTFPPGYPVGEVTSVKRNLGESFAMVAVEPSAALNRSREVLLVWTDTPAPADSNTEQAREE